MNFSNDGSRTLLESVVAPEIIEAISDWSNRVKNGVLIGGIALSFWAKPRYTSDADVIFLKKSDVPSSVDGFRAHRVGAFEHKSTGVEVEVAYPGFIPVPEHVFHDVFKTAVSSGGIRVASKEGLIAMKLYRYSLQDQADIMSLAELGATDLSSFMLDGAARKNLLHWNSQGRIHLKM